MMAQAFCDKYNTTPYSGSFETITIQKFFDAIYGYSRSEQTQNKETE